MARPIAANDQTKTLRQEAARLYRVYEKSQLDADLQIWMAAQRAYADSKPIKSRPASKAGLRQQAEKFARYECR